MNAGSSSALIAISNESGSNYEIGTAVPRDSRSRSMDWNDEPCSEKGSGCMRVSAAETTTDLVQGEPW